MITISHNHAEGTILSGSRKGDGVWEIVRLHGFRGSREVGLYIRGSRDRDAQTWRIEAAATALRAAGFEVTVDIDDQWRPAADREAAYTERADERAERYDERASNEAGRRDARQAAADRTLDMIPGGQPMMPGHHSYRGDRNRRERAWANMDAALVHDRQAGQLAERADAVRAHADAKENPRVVMRRIETLEADQRRWQRELAEAAASTTDTTSYQQRVQREIDRLTENIAHQKAKLAQHAAAGTFTAWAPDIIAKGDIVRGEFGWYVVKRVNRKSVSLDNDRWPTTLPYDKIYGRRRDGQQHDTPTGQPWPVELAQQVARWQQHVHPATNPGYDADQQRHARHVGYARRLVHGLDLSATDQQTAAFWPTAKTPAALAERRRLSAAYLAVFDRLEADERVPDIIAGLTPERGSATWVMPDGPPVDRKPADLHRGDIIAGLWDTGANGRELWPHFQGPVDHVSDPVAHGGRNWVTVTLTGGTDREMTTHQWLAVHPAPAAPAA